MLKIIILGLVLAAIALSGVIYVASVDTCLTPPAVSISGEPLLGPLPEVCISNLPAINETAVVTVTYTHDSTYVVTDTTPQAYPGSLLDRLARVPGF